MYELSDLWKPETIELVLLVSFLINISGSIFNWWVGGHVERYKHRSWYPISEKKIKIGQKFYQRYGYWALLLTGIPFIGNPIIFLAGMLKERFLRFILFIVLSKGLRYILMYLIYIGLF